MKQTILLVLLVTVTVFIHGMAMAQDFIIYPAKGQSQQQMEQDKFECYTWAKQQSGFDPMQMPTATSVPPPDSQASVGGGMLKGGAGGALLGLGVGAISGHAGEGAAIGAASGGLFGGMRARRQQEQAQQAQQQWADQQATQYMQKRNTYNRAYEVCLQGRGYTVAPTFGGMPPAPAPAPAAPPSAVAKPSTAVAPPPAITEQKLPPPVPAPASVAAPSLQTIEQKLKDLKSLLDQGLITQTDYEAKKAQLLQSL